VFERFTDRARRVIILAQEEARMLNHNYIGTEHVVLGLLHEGEGVAAKALVALGIDLDQVRKEIEEIIGKGQEAPTGHVPFTPRTKAALQLSLREALQLGHNYIGTEHILLGLIRQGDGVGAQVLMKLGAELTRVRQQVIQLISGYQGKQAAETDLDPEIAEVRRQKEAAIDAQAWKKAAQLRDKEKELMAKRPVVTGTVRTSEEYESVTASAQIIPLQLASLRRSLVYKVDDPFSGQATYYPLLWSGRTIVGIDWTGR
jgi:ATP-dependent Clp protease ATP-binding subunit ClpA